MALIKIKNVVLKNLVGDAPLKQGQGADAKDMTLKDVLNTALLMENHQETPKPTGKDKADRFYLAYKIEHASDEGVKLTSEEVTLIKTLVGTAWPPLVVGQTYSMLEGEDLKAD